MSEEQLILDAYRAFRVSLGKPANNSLEDIKQSIPYQFFKAGWERTPHGVYYLPLPKVDREILAEVRDEDLL